jgi:hypothetical protein
LGGNEGANGDIGSDWIGSQRSGADGIGTDRIGAIGAEQGDPGREELIGPSRAGKGSLHSAAAANDWGGAESGEPFEPGELRASDLI